MISFVNNSEVHTVILYINYPTIPFNLHRVMKKACKKPIAITPSSINNTPLLNTKIDDIEDHVNYGCFFNIQRDNHSILLISLHRHGLFGCRINAICTESEYRY